MHASPGNSLVHLGHRDFSEIGPDFGKVTVTKVDEGVAWGSVHWQYMEDISKITPHEGTPLKIKKTLYTKEYTKKGPVISPVRGPVKVGDELVVRIELRTDRDMEYVHMKDHRGSFHDGLSCEHIPCPGRYAVRSVRPVHPPL